MSAATMASRDSFDSKKARKAPIAIYVPPNLRASRNGKFLENGDTRSTSRNSNMSNFSDRAKSLEPSNEKEVKKSKRPDKQLYVPKSRRSDGKCETPAVVVEPDSRAVSPAYSVSSTRSEKNQNHRNFEPISSLVFNNRYLNSIPKSIRSKKESLKQKERCNEKESEITCSNVNKIKNSPTHSKKDCDDSSSRENLLYISVLRGNQHKVPELNYTNHQPNLSSSNNWKKKEIKRIQKIIGKKKNPGNSQNFSHPVSLTSDNMLNSSNYSKLCASDSYLLQKKIVDNYFKHSEPDLIDEIEKPISDNMLNSSNYSRQLRASDSYLLQKKIVDDYFKHSEPDLIDEIEKPISFFHSPEVFEEFHFVTYLSNCPRDEMPDPAMVKNVQYNSIVDIPKTFSKKENFVTSSPKSIVLKSVDKTSTVLSNQSVTDKQRSNKKEKVSKNFEEEVMLNWFNPANKCDLNIKTTPNENEVNENVSEIDSFCTTKTASVLIENNDSLNNKIEGNETIFSDNSEESFVSAAENLVSPLKSNNEKISTESLSLNLEETPDKPKSNSKIEGSKLNKNCNTNLKNVNEQKESKVDKKTSTESELDKKMSTESEKLDLTWSDETKDCKNNLESSCDKVEFCDPNKELNKSSNDNKAKKKSENLADETNESYIDKAGVCKENEKLNKSTEDKKSGNLSWADEMERVLSDQNEDEANSWYNLYDDSGIRNGSQDAESFYGKASCDSKFKISPSRNQRNEISESADAIAQIRLEKPRHNYYEFEPYYKSNSYDDFESPESRRDLETMVEIYDFSAAFQTQDLMMIFQEYKGFELRWVDETHAIGIFTSSLIAYDSLKMNHPFIKVRSINQSSVQTYLKATKIASTPLPPKPRPATSAVLARRLVSGALGMKISVPKEQREAEKEKIRSAREHKKLIAKQKQNAWEGIFD